MTARPVLILLRIRHSKISAAVNRFVWSWTNSNNFKFLGFDGTQCVCVLQGPCWGSVAKHQWWLSSSLFFIFFSYGFCNAASLPHPNTFHISPRVGLNPTYSILHETKKKSDKFCKKCNILVKCEVFCKHNAWWNWAIFINQNWPFQILWQNVFQQLQHHYVSSF